MTAASRPDNPELLGATGREHGQGTSVLWAHVASLVVPQELEGAGTGRGQFSELYSTTHCCHKIRTTRGNHLNHDCSIIAGPEGVI